MNGRVSVLIDERDDVARDPERRDQESARSSGDGCDARPQRRQRAERAARARLQRRRQPRRLRRRQWKRRRWPARWRGRRRNGGTAGMVARRRDGGTPAPATARHRADAALAGAGGNRRCRAPAGQAAGWIPGRRWRGFDAGVRRRLQEDRRRAQGASEGEEAARRPAREDAGAPAGRLRRRKSERRWRQRYGGGSRRGGNRGDSSGAQRPRGNDSTGQRRRGGYGGRPGDGSGAVKRSGCRGRRRFPRQPGDAGDQRADARHLHRAQPRSRGPRALARGVAGRRRRAGRGRPRWPRVGQGATQRRAVARRRSRRRPSWARAPSRHAHGSRVRVGQLEDALRAAHRAARPGQPRFHRGRSAVSRKASAS